MKQNKANVEKKYSNQLVDYEDVEETGFENTIPKEVKDFLDIPLPIYEPISPASMDLAVDDIVQDDEKPCCSKSLANFQQVQETSLQKSVPAEVVSMMYNDDELNLEGMDLQYSIINDDGSYSLDGVEYNILDECDDESFEDILKSLEN